MSKKLSLSFIFLVAFCVSSFAQSSKIPSNIQLVDLNGNKVSSSTFSEKGKPVLISFWATWCKPCIQELNAINDVYEDWKDEFDFEVIAISIDDSRTKMKVAPMAKSKGYPFEIFIDENGDFMRALGVQNVPHTFILNSEGEVVKQHTAYSPGLEDEYYELLKELTEKKSEE